MTAPTPTQGPICPIRRIEESRRVVSRLIDDVSAWFAQWRRSPSGPYHKTRLAVLEACLKGHTERLAVYADSLPGVSSPAKTYQEARRVEEVAAWVRKLWEFFRSRFDQRLGRVPSAPDNLAASRPVGEVLSAADEVLWSCFSPVAKPGMAAPLAFLDDQARMTAVYGGCASQVPVTSAAQALLGDFINTLPIPLIGLSPVVAEAPWWLALIGHEIGHHVHDQYACLDSFRIHLVNVARAACPAAAGRWEGWASEVFADWCSAATIGPWAAVALAEQVWGTDDDLITADHRYPPAIVRLELILRLAAAYKIPAESVPPGYSWAALEQRVHKEGRAAQALTAVVEDLKVTDALIAEVNEKHEFERLLEVRKQLVPDLAPDDGSNPLAMRSDYLIRTRADTQAPLPDKSLQQLPAARMLAAAAVKAWQMTSTTADRSQLASRVILVLQHAVAPGERAGRSYLGETAEWQAKGAEHIDYLLQQFRIEFRS